MRILPYQAIKLSGVLLCDLRTCHRTSGTALVFSLTSSQMVAQQFKAVNIYGRHLYFMKTVYSRRYTLVFSFRLCVFLEQVFPFH